MRHKTNPAMLLAAVAAGALMLLGACGENPTASREAQAPSDPLMHLGPNHAPVSVPRVQDWGRGECKPLAVDGVPSTDADIGDRPSLTYAWNFGDGTTGSGRFTTHTYQDNGTYTVALRVTDMHGAFDDSTTSVSIHNVNPQPGPFTHPDSVVEGVSFQIALNSATDCSADVAAGLEYSFNCGSGSWSGWGLTANRTCPGLPDNGSYVVGIRVRDKDGGIAGVSAPITVLNAIPVVVFPCTAVTRDGGWVNLKVCWTDVSADRRATVEVDWDDGISDTRIGAASPTAFGHKYVPGTYTIRFQVTDKDGGTSTPLTEIPVTIP